MDLFSPLKIRDITFRNRIAVSPMCQYSCIDGLASDWHLVHLGSRAVGGAGLVMVEASAVEARGRITPSDMGIWNDQQVAAFKPITAFIKQQGAAPGIQLAHAGRKASTRAPWVDRGAQLPKDKGGWDHIAPSALPFYDTDRPPIAMSKDEIHKIVDAFRESAKRALDAGFEVLELHGAHGYLMNEFLSPLTNRRDDDYGGTFENRIRFAVEIITATRLEWPAELPLFLRISATDWVEGGWTIGDSVKLALAVKPLGVDLVDCSSGGVVAHASIPAAPGYQVPFAAQVKREAGIPTGAVGMITEPEQANDIIATGEADLVLLAREMLRDPYWPLHAARALGAIPSPPVQYGRAF